MFVLRPSRLIPLLLLILLPVAPFAQQSPATKEPTPSTPSTPSVPTVPSAPKVVPQPGIFTVPDFRLPPREIQPIFLAGNVMREDGSPPPVGTIIELDCGTSRTREASVGPNGYFAFQYGGAQRFNSIVPDASEGNGHINDEDAVYWNPLRSSADSRVETTTPLYIRLSGCDLKAQVAGYRSSSLTLNPTNLTRVNSLGTIIVYPLERVRGTVVSAASLLAPKKAKERLKRARKALEKGKDEEAESLLREAIAGYGAFGEAWLELGRLEQGGARYAEAREAYERALAGDPLYVPPYVALGWLNALERKWAEAADIIEKALDLDPVSFPEAYYVSALAHYNLGDYDQAGKRAEQTVLRDSTYQFPKVHLIRANLFSLRRDTGAADEAMRLYLRHAPDAPEAELVRARLENGRPGPPEKR
ncbi:MAG: tetratricopeptide repeat protein [Acidobacteria bacterium]|nr:tetratricopeptide repeat protein [Acidobacteriota bacterium]